MMRASLVLFVCVGVALGASPPSVALKNAAEPGTTMPVVGLGTGGYGTKVDAVYPECWAEPFGCGAHTTNATAMWLKEAGGVRLDNADSYFNQKSLQAGMAASGVSRDKIFVTSKTGNTNAMGYNDTMSQFATTLADLQTTYVDLLLIHWPTSPAKSTQPDCNQGPAFNATSCRLTTWQAYNDLFTTGKVRAIGTANFQIDDLMEMVNAGMPLPAVNQIPISPYRFATQLPLIKFCQAHDIHVQAYSPFGIPDLTVDAAPLSSLLLHKYPAPMSPNLLNDSVLASVAAKYSKTPAQIIINFLWAHTISTNPRSRNLDHMMENLSSFDFTLDAADISALASRPQDFCSATGSQTKDDQWYECAPASPSSASAASPWATVV